MLRWALPSLALALVAGVFGFSGRAGDFAPLVQAVFFIALVLTVALLLARLVRGPRVSGRR
ncbi:DUF1328 domain-containing protein [Marinicauda algicola]|uniref:UPF0391 membrane protein E5163_02610 n=1 Tax=Marinicauda algicola TaxID=2029849 RepID=A0A4S2H339_9PROT|nr:DUF1328 family protein [Marinicauda algicola]TGY90040.1 DUF1328 domain-containing protein [Marinicauda algicola]